MRDSLVRYVVMLVTLACHAPAAVAADAAPTDAPQEVVVFESKTEGYASFRIPAVVATPKGTLLAFCEARKDSASDNGNIDTVLRRSTDGGVTWGPLQRISDVGPDCIGNPCPVVDRTTGRVWLPLMRKPGKNSTDDNKLGTGHGPMEVFLCHSDDDGATWSEPRNITPQVKPKDWTWYVVGPGCGIQLRDGRLVLPCDHRVAGSADSFSHVVYSDDGGKTWQVGGSSAEKTNECQVAELDDGSLVLNMRSHHKRNRRAVATSTDRGQTWSPMTFDEGLIEPTCQASLIRLDGSGPGGKSAHLFANPASTKRERMTVRLSTDGCKTWPLAGVLYEGPAAYSSLVALPGGRAGCLYEKDKYKQIVFTRFGLGWLKPVAPTPASPGNPG